MSLLGSCRCIHVQITIVNCTMSIFPSWVTTINKNCDDADSDNSNYTVSRLILWVKAKAGGSFLSSDSQAASSNESLCN